MLWSGCDVKSVQQNMVGKKLNILCGAVGAAMLLTVGMTIIYYFCPAVYATFRSLFFPEKVYRIKATFGNKQYTLSLYCKRYGHQSFNSRNVFPVLVLCDLPLPEDYQHIKIFPNGIGVFQTPSDWFVVRKNYLYLESGARMTVAIENDMKGWKAAYSITRQGDKYIYRIAPGKKKGRIRPFIEFAIPAFLLENIPELSTCDRIGKKCANKLFILPLTCKNADISCL